MNTFDVFALANSISITERLGWVLIHSVWQFTAIAILSTLVVRCLWRSTANTRYSFLVLAMATLVVCPIATFCLQTPEPLVGSEFTRAPERSHLETSSQPSMPPQSNNGLANNGLANNGWANGQGFALPSNPQDGKLVTELPTEAHDAAFSNDGKWFATGFSDDKQALSVWKLLSN